MCEHTIKEKFPPPMQEGVVEKRYGVVVTFKTQPGCAQEFISLACAFARETRKNDAGCLQYDVLNTADEQIVFLEIYRAADDHHRHLQTPELAEFRRAREGLVASHNFVAGFIEN